MKNDDDLFDSESWNDWDDEGFINKPIKDGEGYVRKTQGIKLDIDFNDIVNESPKPQRVVPNCINCRKPMTPKSGKVFCSDKCKKQLHRLMKEPKKNTLTSACKQPGETAQQHAKRLKKEYGKEEK